VKKSKENTRLTGKLRKLFACVALPLACPFLVSPQLIAVSFNEEEPWNFKPKKFIEKNGDSSYAPVAQAMVNELAKYPNSVIQPKSFFKSNKPADAKP
jgi:hypothetical protein